MYKTAALLTVRKPHPAIRNAKMSGGAPGKYHNMDTVQYQPIKPE